ncbi:hypothetical protein [Rhodococcus sp. NPDC049939]|uniref:hypothetical protein n=1 Tax=Rhodococcus sp. NPDC049939 TaxID=3155511 RepID=UPI0033F84DAA
MLVGLLLARGIIDAELADLITGGLTLVLGITAAEKARNKVTPTVKVVETVETPRPGCVRRGTRSATAPDSGRNRRRFG